MSPSLSIFGLNLPGAKNFELWFCFRRFQSLTQVGGAGGGPPLPGNDDDGGHEDEDEHEDEAEDDKDDQDDTDDEDDSDEDLGE